MRKGQNMGRLNACAIGVVQGWIAEFGQIKENWSDLVVAGAGEYLPPSWN